jgi:hypothetical protein
MLGVAVAVVTLMLGEEAMAMAVAMAGGRMQVATEVVAVVAGTLMVATEVVAAATLMAVAEAATLMAVVEVVGDLAAVASAMRVGERHSSAVDLTVWALWAKI